jgi:Tol biopolymer transport system component
VIIHLFFTAEFNISKGITLTPVGGYLVDSWSPDGKLLMYHAGDDISGFDYVLVAKANGKNKTLIVRGDNAVVSIISCSWFQDSKRVAYALNYKNDDHCELWIMDIVRKEKKRILRLKDTYVSDIKISPDGKTLVYIKVPSGKDKEVWVMKADGADNRKLMLGPESGSDYGLNLKWYSNSKSLYYVKRTEPKTDSDDFPDHDLYAIDIDGTNNRQILGCGAIGKDSNIEIDDGGYFASADGKQILYRQWDGDSNAIIRTVNVDGSNNQYLYRVKKHKSLPYMNGINPSWTAICNDKDKLEIVDFKQEKKTLTIEQAHTLLDNALGHYSYGDVSWSPDGNKIAYVRRYYEGLFQGDFFGTLASSEVWIADISKAR